MQTNSVRAAIFVNKILKETSPAAIAVEQPVKFEFIVNLKSATQIGVTIPPQFASAGRQGNQIRQK